MVQFTGSCLCGDIQIIATGEPYRVGICHCIDCRKHHGALFYASAIFATDAVSISGKTQSYADRHFCPRCGSPVFAVSGDEIEVNLGCLDNTDLLKPTYELWCIRREAWLPAFPNTRVYAQNRNSSSRHEDQDTDQLT